MEAARQTQGLAHAHAADAWQFDLLALAADAFRSVADSKGSFPGPAVEPGGSVCEVTLFRGPDAMAQGLDGVFGDALGTACYPTDTSMP